MEENVNETNETQETPETQETQPEVTPTPATEAPAAEAKRPTFLTVLCILSFIGCALQLLGNIATIGTAIGIVNVLAAVICFVGVLLMWKLKKTGFYIYVVGEIAPIIVGIIVLGAAGLFSFAGGFFAKIMVLAYVFPIAFLIMYGLNFKHLK